MNEIYTISKFIIIIIIIIIVIILDIIIRLYTPFDRHAYSENTHDEP